LDPKLKGRLQFIGIVCIFGLPFILGPIAYKFGWFETAVNNKGTLMSPPVHISDYSVEYHVGAFKEDTTWRLLLNKPRCGDECLDLVNMMANTRQALGREKDRVNVMVWNQQLSDINEKLIASYTDLDIGVVGSVTNELAPAIYIVDTHGNIILKYDIQTSVEGMIAQGRDILKDLKKLLKVSRIG
jgi:hypothetical protein